MLNDRLLFLSKKKKKLYLIHLNRKKSNEILEKRKKENIDLK